MCPITRIRLVSRAGGLATQDKRIVYPVVSGVPVLLGPVDATDYAPIDHLWQQSHSELRDQTGRTVSQIFADIDLSAYQREVSEFIPECKGSAVLEVLSGAPSFQNILASRVGVAGHITILGPSLLELRSSKKLTNPGLPSSRHVCAETTNLPFLSQAFDGLIFWGVCAASSYATGLLSEFARVVKPGGWIVYSGEILNTSSISQNGWRPRMLRTLNPGRHDGFPRNPTNLTCLSEREVASGFAYVRVLNRPGFSRHFRAVGNNVSRTLRETRRQPYCGGAWGCKTSRCN